MLKNALSLLSLMTLSIAQSACIAETVEFSNEDEGFVGETSDELMFDSTTVDSRIVGGTGGTDFGATLCPAGHVAVGLDVRYDTYINGIRMRCALLKDDATLGAIVYSAFRGSGFGESKLVDCPAGQVLAGEMLGATSWTSPAAYINMVGGYCLSVSKVLTRNAKFTDLTHFGPFGSASSASGYPCPLGYAVIGFRGRAGSYIDQLGFICGKMLDPHVASYPVTLTDLTTTTIHAVRLNDQNVQFLNVSPGATVKVTTDYSITQWDSCPGCIDQIMIGLAPQAPKGCVYDWVPSLTGTSGTGSVSFAAPTTPGIYPIRFRTTMEWHCNMDAWNTKYTPSSAQDIAYINVQQ